MAQNKISILIDSATGQLGSLITKHALLRDNLLVNILVRNPDKNKQLVDEVEKAGGRVIKGDLSDPASLKDVTKGIHTVISAISSFGPKALVDGELALLDDAVKNGAKRFVHSYYGINYAHVSDDDAAVFIPQKEAVRQQVHKAPIGAIDISTGMFIETFALFQADGAHYAGDVNQKIDLSSYEDVAKYIVAVVSRKDLTGTFAFASQQVTVPEFVDIYNKVRGTNIEPKYLGTTEEYKKLRNEERKNNPAGAWVKDVEYLLYTGIGKFSKHHNSEFPEVTHDTIEQIITKNTSLQLK